MIFRNSLVADRRVVSIYQTLARIHEYCSPPLTTRIKTNPISDIKVFRNHGSPRIPGQLNNVIQRVDDCLEDS